MSAKDLQTIEEYGGKSGFMPDLRMYSRTPESTKDFEGVLRSFQRNRGKLNPKQQGWLDVMEGKRPSPFAPIDETGWITDYQGPGMKLDETFTPPKPPAGGDKKDFDRLQVIQTPEGGKMKWYDESGKWVEAPQEFKYLKGGKEGNMTDFDTVQQFDYQTGTWKDVPAPEGGWRPGGYDEEAGVNVGGNIPGMVHMFGQPKAKPKQQSVEDYLKQYSQQGTPAGQI